MDQKTHYETLSTMLSADRFVQVAKEQSGLSDFGDESFLVPMRKVLDCVAQDSDFHPQGLENFRADVVRFLVTRLRVQHDIKLHPEILQEDVSDPVIVIGMGRSGTTKLHKMLSAADNVQKTFFWRMLNPAPFPDAVPGQRDPRIAAAGYSDRTSDKNAELDAAHHMLPQEVEEEWMLYLFTFENWIWCNLTQCHSFFDWLMSRNSLKAFQYVKTLLQYLQWQDGGKRGRPWMLKSTGYIADVDSLLACYPNATLVHMHRDPRDTVPSYSKVQSIMWSQQSNPGDPRFAGAETLKMWSTAMNRYLDVRERLKLDDCILDAQYDTLRTDPMSIIRQVYARAGLPMSDESAAKMQAWHDNNEQHQHGKHVYSLEEFGLSEESIDKAFRRYIDRFIDR